MSWFSMQDQSLTMWTNGPNVMVLNARSILNKVDELKAHIDNYKSDILFVTETWLTETIPI